VLAHQIQLLPVSGQAGIVERHKLRLCQVGRCLIGPDQAFQECAARPETAGQQHDIHQPAVLHVVGCVPDASILGSPIRDDAVAPIQCVADL